jgi:hypothetical protein
MNPFSQLVLSSEAVNRAHALPGAPENGGYVTPAAWFENDQCIAIAQ